MAKPKQPTEDQKTPTPSEGADQIVLDPSTFQEVILGSSVAEPLPVTWERVDH